MENPNYVQYPRFHERKIRFEALGESWNWFKRDAGLYVLAALPGVLLSFLILAWFFNYTLQNAGNPEAVFSGLGIQVLVQLGFSLILYLTVGMVSYVAVKRIDGQSVGPFDGLSKINWGSMVVATFVIGLLVTFGSYLCILPGLIAGGLFLVTYPLIADQGRGPFDAMGASVDAVKSSMWTAVALYFVAGLVMGLSVACCGVGLLIGLPIYSITLAIAYRDVFPVQGQEAV